MQIVMIQNKSSRIWFVTTVSGAVVGAEMCEAESAAALNSIVTDKGGV
jgi:hypothetical protein